MLYVIAFAVGIAIGSMVAQQLAKRHWKAAIRADRQTLLNQYDGKLSEAQQQREAAESVSRKFAQQTLDWRQQEQHWQAQKQSLTAEARSRLDKIQQLENDLTAQQQAFQQLNDTLATNQKAHHEAIALEREQAQAAAQSMQAEYEALTQKNADDYAAQLKAVQEQNTELQAENTHYKENIDVSLQLSKDVEKKKNELLAQKQTLSAQVQQLQTEIVQQEQIQEKALEAVQKEVNLDLVEIVETLFPTVELLYHSKAEIQQHDSEFGNLLLALKKLIDEEQLSQPKKVHATSNKWWEGRVGRQGRLYYHKVSGDPPRYRIVIAWKSGDKDQKKVIGWLKNNYRTEK
ncbi:MAG: hypothetical protein AB8B99_03630 [Phormidesmis sp.]